MANFLTLLEQLTTGRVSVIRHGDAEHEGLLVYAFGVEARSRMSAKEAAAVEFIHDDNGYEERRYRASDSERRAEIEAELQALRRVGGDEQRIKELESRLA